MACLTNSYVISTETLTRTTYPRRFPVRRSAAQPRYQWLAKTCQAM